MNNAIKSQIFVFIALGVFATLSACSQVRTPSHPSHPSYPSPIQERGKASYYADKYHGRKTASGERFNQNALSAAHRTLEFGTKVKVTNISNGKSVVVEINDRGPFVKGRIIDLSKTAFRSIANPSLGLVDVVIEVIKR